MRTTGERIGMVQPQGSTTYTYDSYGRLTGLTNPYSEVTSFAYDSLSRITQKSLSSGTKEVYSYDSLDRLSSMQVKNLSNSVLRSEGYTYNVVNEVLTHTENGVTTSYGYDAASQLTSEFRRRWSKSIRVHTTSLNQSDSYRQKVEKCSSKSIVDRSC
jgi:YD repeat-containing protein